MAAPPIVAGVGLGVAVTGLILTTANVIPATDGKFHVGFQGNQTSEAVLSDDARTIVLSHDKTYKIYENRSPLFLFDGTGGRFPNVYFQNRDVTDFRESESGFWTKSIVGGVEITWRGSDYGEVFFVRINKYVWTDTFDSSEVNVDISFLPNHSDDWRQQGLSFSYSGFFDPVGVGRFTFNGVFTIDAWGSLFFSQSQLSSANSNFPDIVPEKHFVHTRAAQDTTRIPPISYGQKIYIEAHNKTLPGYAAPTVIELDEPIIELD